MSAPELYIPPKPLSLWSVVALARVLWKGDGNLLELLPAAAYHFDVGNLGYSRRSTVLFNEPDAVREIMRDAEGVFPKSDLMVSALEHLIGDSIFVTDGERWKRQRAMIDPAFSHMRISHAFGAMKAAVDDHLLTLEEKAASGESFSLDLAMSHLTADIICRTVFSTPLQTGVAVDVFEDFTLFERSAVQVDVLRLIFKPAWSDIPQPPEVLAACERIDCVSYVRVEIAVPEIRPRRVTSNPLTTPVSVSTSNVPSNVPTLPSSVYVPLTSNTFTASRARCSSVSHASRSICSICAERLLRRRDRIPRQLMQARSAVESNVPKETRRS